MRRAGGVKTRFVLVSHWLLTIPRRTAPACLAQESHDGFSQTPWRSGASRRLFVDNPYDFLRLSEGPSEAKCVRELIGPPAQNWRAPLRDKIDLGVGMMRYKLLLTVKTIATR